MTSVLAVVGPTASGKTALAIELAEQFDTEVISADSMQVYRGMEIGTGAPDPDQLARVPHHYISCLNPDEDFSAGAFEQGARTIVSRLNAQGRIAVVVGGSGLYVSALIDGLFEGPPKDEALRLRLLGEAEANGIAPLYTRLQHIDPGYAALIHAGDLRRIVRALEVHTITGKSLSAHHAEHQEGQAGLGSVQVAFDWPRDALYARIDKRVDQMIENGFVDEVSALTAKGYRPQIERLRSLGYREMLSYLDGLKTLDEAVAATKMHTRRYAKRQLSWFRTDQRVRWFKPGTHPRSIAQEIGLSSGS